jgi:hypothetical protein
MAGLGFVEVTEISDAKLLDDHACTQPSLSSSRVVTTRRHLGGAYALVVSGRNQGERLGGARRRGYARPTHRVVGGGVVAVGIDSGASQSRGKKLRCTAARVSFFCHAVIFFGRRRICWSTPAPKNWGHPIIGHPVG